VHSIFTYHAVQQSMTPKEKYGSFPHSYMPAMVLYELIHWPHYSVRDTPDNSWLGREVEANRTDGSRLSAMLISLFAPQILLLKPPIDFEPKTSAFQLYQGQRCSDHHP
jgi:hypothetical protein